MDVQEPAWLQDLLAQRYGLGRLREAQRLTRGYVNVSYIIDVEKAGEAERYFFRAYKRGITEPEVRFEHSLIRHLIGESFDLVADLIPTREGGTYVKTRGEQGETRFFAVFEFLPGEDRYAWDDPICTPEELRRAAAVLASYHAHVRGWEPQGERLEPPILDLLPVIEGNVRRFAQGAGDTIFDEYFLDRKDPILERVERTRSVLGNPDFDRLTQLAIHCDYHPGNLKFQAGEITGLFDFDWSKLDVRVFDLALAMNYFCVPWDEARDGQPQLDRMGTFLEGYQLALERSERLRPLNGLERSFLPAMFDASILFLANWTLVDFYTQQGMDPQEYRVYLRHILRSLAWTGDPDNRRALERVFVG
jgi:homoserine kinase type II